MTANVDVMGERKDKVLTVPWRPCSAKDDAELVYVKRWGRAGRRKSPAC
jgi:hypothetical protein